MPNKVLVVDDDGASLELVTGLLGQARYEVRVARSGEQGLAVEARERPDLIVLELMLPDMDGFDVCRRLRRRTSAPIIILTGRADLVDRVVGLEVGADDYVTKPFGVQEFLARVKAALRRASKVDAPSDDRALMDFGEVIIDRSRHQVIVRGAAQHLTRKEFELLRVLAANAGRVVTIQTLLREVWHCPIEIVSRTVDVHIGRVRAKIEQNRDHPRLIVTVPRVGYKFVPPAERFAWSAPSPSEVAGELAVPV